MIVSIEVYFISWGVPLVFCTYETYRHKKRSFTGLSTLDNVSLAVVAPGIAEALVATAIGLFAAIPAVAAYNYYNNRVGRLTVRLEGFSEEFLNILQRQHARS